MIGWFKTLIGRLQGYGECHHCHNTWNWKNGHYIPYSKERRSFMFPLCKECYEKLSPQSRYNYCLELYYSWDQPTHKIDFETIAKHVGLDIRK